MWVKLIDDRPHGRAELVRIGVSRGYDQTEKRQHLGFPRRGQAFDPGTDLHTIFIAEYVVPRDPVGIGLLSKPWVRIQGDQSGRLGLRAGGTGKPVQCRQCLLVKGILRERDSQEPMRVFMLTQIGGDLSAIDPRPDRDGADQASILVEPGGGDRASGHGKASAGGNDPSPNRRSSPRSRDR